MSLYCVTSLDAPVESLVRFYSHHTPDFFWTLLLPTRSRNVFDGIHCLGKKKKKMQIYYWFLLFIIIINRTNTINVLQNMWIITRSSQSCLSVAVTWNIELSKFTFTRVRYVRLWLLLSSTYLHCGINTSERLYIPYSNPIGGINPP